MSEFDLFGAHFLINSVPVTVNRGHWCSVNQFLLARRLVQYGKKVMQKSTLQKFQCSQTGQVLCLERFLTRTASPAPEWYTRAHYITVLSGRILQYVCVLGLYINSLHSDHPRVWRGTVR